MTVALDVVREHYQAEIKDPLDLLDKLNSIVDQIGTNSLSETDLAGLDQFHIGGLPATIELAKRAGLQVGMQVLDAGSGLGGPARYLAQTFDCEVVGVDLAPAYVAIAELLAHRAGLAGRVSFQVGDLCTLPFVNGAFDLAWTQHVMMNIRDRKGVYRELRRVLKAKGKLAFFDVVAADEGPLPHYPVPWAQTPKTSFLLTEDETITCVESSGFEILRWNNVTKEAMVWAALQQAGPAPAGLGLVMGSRLGQMVANFKRSLTEGGIRLVMGIAETR